MDSTSTPLNVQVLQGCLIITVQEPEQEPEVMRTLRKVCKLSARKQRQIAEFILLQGSGLKDKIEMEFRF